MSFKLMWHPFRGHQEPTNKPFFIVQKTQPWKTIHISQNIPRFCKKSTFRKQSTFWKTFHILFFWKTTNIWRKSPCRTKQSTIGKTTNFWKFYLGFVGQRRNDSCVSKMINFAKQYTCVKESTFPKKRIFLVKKS